MRYGQLKQVFFMILIAILTMGIIPYASAAEDIGLSVAVPYAGGENGLYLSWDSVSTAEYYCYSVRNVTTNELLVDRKQTSKTSATVKGEWIEGHEYRVWAGACCGGNDPDNTSTWDYTGQKVITVRNCPHSDTEEMWKKETNIQSVSDTHHEITGYMIKYCVECFEQVGSSYEATERYKHDFDENGNCPTCDYSPECKHEDTKLVKLKGFPNYEFDDEINHIVDIQYKRVCVECDSVVNSLDDSVREYYREPHEYNSEGECHYCDFVMPVKQEPLTLSVSVSQSGAETGTNIGATAHAEGGTGNYSYAWIVTFNGGEIDRTDYTGRNYCSVAANQEGSYVFNAYVQDGNGNQISASSSEVVVTAPACKHPGTDIMWDTGMGMTYENVSDDIHAIHGYVYEYCTDCFERVGSSYAMTENHPHDFNDAGDCPTCGYTKTCPHAETKCAAIEGYPDYRQEDEANHIVDIQYKRICQDCNSVLEKVVDSEREYYREAHDYDSEGVCRYCDFVMPAKQKALTLSVSVNQTNAETGTNIGATAHAEGGTGNYSYAWIVTFNGDEIDRTDHTGGSYYSVEANQEGSYVFTAYVQDGNGEQISASSSEIAVTAPACKHSYTDIMWDTSMGMTCENVSDDGHAIHGYVYEYCMDCFERVGSSYAMTENYPHDFNDGGDCPTCGYTKDCPHAKTKCVAIEGYPDYSQEDEANHIVDIQYKRICQDCSSVVEKVVDSAREYYREAHDYDSEGVCCYCDFVMPARQKDLTLSVSVNQMNAETGTNIGATAHAAGGSGNYSYAWIVTRNGSEFDRTDYMGGSYYSVAASQEGSYVFTAYIQDGNGNQISASSSEIVVTAPVCSHSSKGLAWDTSLDMDYSSISDDEHSISGYAYEYCRECYGRVGENFWMTANYPHDFNDAGDCPTCGYPENYSQKGTENNNEGFHIHIYETVKEGEPSYTNLNEKEHSVTTMYLEKCLSCGDAKNQKIESRMEEHAYTDKGHIEAAHHDGKGHQTFDRCICGAAAYTGYASYKNCCECNGHNWLTAQKVNDEWRTYCRRCGCYQVVSEPTGEVTTDNNGNTFIPSGESCTQHMWNETVYDMANRAAFHLCAVCGQIETVSNKKAEEYTAYRELQDGLGYGDGAYWELLAQNANNYLSSGAGAFGESISAAAKGGSYLYEAISDYRDERILGMDDRSLIEVGIWMDIIMDISAETSRADSIAEAGTNVLGVASEAVDRMLNSAINDAIGFVNEKQTIVDRLEMTIQTYSWEYDRSFSAFQAAEDAGEKMQSAQNNLNAARERLNAFDGPKGLIEAMPFMFAAVNGLAEGYKDADKISKLEKKFESMAVQYEDQAIILMSIIEDAKKLNNLELECAAQTILNEVSDNYVALYSETSTELTKVLDGIVDAAKTEGAGILGFLDGASEFLSGELTAMIGATKKSISPLWIIQTSAGIANLTTNADEVAVQCEMLSILRDMSSNLDQVNQFSYENSISEVNYTAQIWGKLQQIGDDEAAKLVDKLMKDKWYNFLSPSGSTLNDFGIDVDKDTIIKVLMDEKGRYQRYIDSI